MIKIGFIDYYLDEWHANNYPAWMRDIARAQGWDIDICYAYGQMDKPGGLTTQAWCEKNGVESCPTIEDLVEKSDAILVLSPDNSEQHERLGDPALRSGKPVYMDKTFSPDLASGIRMFDLAERHATPLCSSSALRYAKALIPNGRSEQVSAVVTTGPGSLETYAV
ncbi:MAG TPA: Gfo/Idh/MocA family oxidoreductase, partial [Clostridia bacterium]|nr:Gfo/Idh/MocA family oxidoreductase [Clostridia bacterium]